MSIKLQVSGITTQDALFICLKHQIDHIGVVFYGLSPRNVSFNHANQFDQLIPSNIKKVAVVVNPDKLLIKNIKASFNPHYFQFDDNQNAEELQNLKSEHNINIIKTIYIKDEIDHKLIESFESVVDGFLFESIANSNLYVDQAENHFDWALLKNFKSSKFWILSGGLNKFNVHEAIRVSNAKMISASSTLEGSPGIKDVEILEEFLRIAKLSK